MRKIATFIFFLIIFFGLRTYNLEKRINFSMDQGMFSLRAYEIWRNKELTLIGPQASPIVDERHFFQGPITYYVLTGLYLLTNWNPVGVSLILIIISLGSLGFLFKFAKEIFDEKAAWIAVWLWAGIPLLIDFSHLIWNPNFLLLLTPVIYWFWWKSIKKGGGWWWMSGVITGVGLQFHFQGFILVLLELMCLIFVKRSLKTGIIWLTGLAVGYSPLLIFDLRHNFYNLKTLFAWIFSGGQQNINWPIYYFLVLFPITVVFVAKILSKRKSVAYIGIILVLLWGIVDVLKTKSAKGMPNHWNYVDLKTTEGLILHNLEYKFNIVNLLSGDTVFYPLRFLLTVDGKPPEQVDKYMEIHELYIVYYKDKPIDMENIWELKLLKEYKKVKEWQVNEKVNLIKLEG